MNLRHKTSYEQACEQERVQVYRLNLHQLRLVDEFIGFVPAEVVGKILKVDTPEREPRHIAFLVARAETSLCPTFRYLGRSLDLTGAEVTIVSSDEKYPESILTFPLKFQILYLDRLLIVYVTASLLRPSCFANLI